MKIRPFAPKPYALAVALLFTATQLQSATYFVSVDGSGFSPSSLNINTGDTVVWTNEDPDFSHTTTSTLSIFNVNYWNYLLVGYQDTASKTFNNVGTFNYFDQLDIGTGSVTVSTPAPPPVITLENLRVQTGKFLFDGTGVTPGRTNVMQVSTNLVQWNPVSTNIAVTSSMTFTNAVTTGPHFFRVYEQP